MSKGKIEELTKRLEAIKLRKEERTLQKQLDREEKKYIKEERLRLKHPKLYKAKKVVGASAKVSGKALGRGIGYLYVAYSKGKRVQERKRIEEKRRLQERRERRSPLKLTYAERQLIKGIRGKQQRRKLRM